MSQQNQTRMINNPTLSASRIARAWPIRLPKHPKQEFKIHSRRLHLSKLVEKKRKNWRGTLTGLAMVFICVIGALGYWVKGWLDWNEEVTKPVTYKMPAAAQILDQYTSPSDFFGDFTYCASFRLPEPELDNLLSKGFDWIQAESWGTSTSDLPNWQTGRFPHEIPGSPCDNLKPWLYEAKTYRYLFAKGERNDWMRLLAVDEQEKIIFYFRGSW